MTRCTDRDIALVIYDEPACVDNADRIVRVRGPVAANEKVRMVCWLVKPLTKKLYAVQDCGVVTRQIVRWGDCVEHPDAWLLPIRPCREDPVLITEQTHLPEVPG